MEKEVHILGHILKDLTQLRIHVLDVFSRTSLLLQPSQSDWKETVQQRIESIQSILGLLQSHAHELEGKLHMI
jgi:hypothetical protein